MRSFIFQKVLFFIPRKLIDEIRFEIVSRFGRLFSSPLSINPNSKNLINLGSGASAVRGFINVDFYRVKATDYRCDLRYPLEIPDETIDGIFSEHTLEHLTYAEVHRLLKECFRVLKRGSGIRIIVPDVSLFIRSYHEGDNQWFKTWENLMYTTSSDPDRARRTLVSNIQALSFVTQEYGHVSCWDYITMKYFLEISGFSNAKQLTFRRGLYPDLLVDLDSADRKFVSLYVEATK